MSFINKIDLLSKYIQSEGSEPIVNPNFLNWMRSDQLLPRWSFSTIDKEVIGQVIHCGSVAELWTTLDSLFSRQTVTRSFQLKQQLKSIKKGDMMVTNYVLRIKTINHALAAIGEPLNDQDILMTILHGLDEDYDTVVGLSSQMDEIDLEKV